MTWKKIKLNNSPRQEIVEKINTGKKDDLKIEAKQVEGFDKLTTQANLDRAIGILDQRTQFLINKPRVSSFNGLTGDLTLAAGTNITLTPSGNTVTISSNDSAVAVGGTVTGGTAGSVLFVGTGAILAQDNANFFFDDTNNRLGIGTATPSSSLHLKTTTGIAIFERNETPSSTSGAYILAMGTSASTASGQRLGRYAFGSAAISNDSASVSAYSGAAWAGGDTSSYLTFSTTPAASITPAERMRINSDGNVGIGVTAPAQKLSVLGDANTYTALIKGDATTGQSYGLLLDAGTNTSDYPLRVRSVGGTDYFAIRGDGNVGIGTTSPLAKLDTRINLAATDTGNNVVSYIAGSNEASTPFVLATGWTGSATASARVAWLQTQQIGTGNQGNLALQPFAGNVGIGTASPSEKLHVVGNILASGGGILLADTFNNAANNANIIYRSSTNTIVGNNANALVVQDGGNVGIGTASPATQLHLYGAAQNTSTITDAGGTGATLFLDNSSSETTNSGGLLLFGSTGHRWAGIKGLLTNGGGNYVGDLAFSTRNATSDTALTERMRITSGGLVGIGVTPAYKLDIATAVANDRGINVVNTAATGTNYGGVFRLSGASSSNNGVVLDVTGGTLNKALVITATTAAANNYAIYSDAAAQSYFAGNVGIGTTGPTAVLHLKAGTATASTAPLKFTTGVNLTTAEIGTMEYNNTHYLTNWKILRYSIGGTLFDHFADVASTSTDGTEDDIYTDTLIASTFGTNGDQVTETEEVDFVASATATRRLKKYVAGTLVFDSGSLTLSLGGTFSLTTQVIRESSSILRVTVTVATTSASSVPYVTYTKITGLTLTNTQVIKTTGIASGAGAASGDITNRMAKITFQPSI